MLKTIFKKFFSTSTLIISFQLCFSPLVFAQAQDGMSNSETKWNKVATGFSIGATVFNSAVAQVTQAEKQQRAAAYQQELGATLELRPVDQNQVPPVFSGCFVLPAKGNRLSQAKMCNAKTLQEVDAGYADAMISIAESNKNVVDNYLTKGNERFTTQGKGCYEKKLEDFNARLLAREEELNKYREKLKALMDNFELAAKNDLEGIKQTSALLNGGTKDNNYLKDFKFETVFLGNDANSACGSTFSAAEFARTGAQKNGGGLRGIEKMLFEKMNKPSNNSMSAAEVLTKSNQLSKEVDEIANKMSDHMKNRNSAEVSVDDISFSGRLLSKDNKALNRVVKNFNSELKNKIGDLESSTKFSTISGSNPIAAQVKAGNIDSQDLEKKLTRFNQQSRKSCLDSIIKSNFTSKENFAKSFKNPSISKGLSRDADNILTTSILSYWNSTDDINDLVTKIKKTESKGMNHLYRMTTGKSFKFDNNKTINASTPMRASQLLGILVSNCNSDFENKDSGNGYSNSDIANNIRTYANQQRQIKKIASYNLAKHIKDEMKSCPSDTTTGVAALSCSNALNSNDQNFCVRTATRCATNMSACYKKATEQIKTVRGNQDALIQKYNTNVEGFKTNMKKELLALNNYIENQARTFDSQLNVGSVFKVPAADFGLAKQSFIVDKKEGIGEDLKIQDPKTYLTNALVDIGKMEAAMKKQRHEYMGASGQDGKLGIIKKEYLANYAKEKAYWATIIADCQGRKQQVAQEKQAINKQKAEENEKLNKACMELVALGKNPSSVEHMQLAEDLSSLVQLAAATPMGANASMSDRMAIDEIRSFDNQCEVTEGNNHPLLSSNAVTLNQLCADTKIKDAAKEMFASAKIDLLCGAKDDSPGTCSDKEIQKIVGTNGKYSKCGKTSAVKLTTKCAEHDNTVAISIDTYEKFEDYTSFWDAIGCDQPGANKDTARQALQNIVNAYNCKKSQERAGQIYVSICNANQPYGGNNNYKDMNLQMAQDVGGAIGNYNSLKN